MTGRYRIEDNEIIDTYRNNKMNADMLCEKLNDLEETRLRKNRELKKFRDREDRYQRVIGGMMAFMELHLNSELWWD